MKTRWTARDWFLPWVMAALAVAELGLRGPRLAPALACLTGLALIPLRQGPWRLGRWVPYLLALPFLVAFAAQVAGSREGRAGWDGLWLLPGWYFASLSVLQTGSLGRSSRPVHVGWSACLAMILSGPVLTPGPLVATLLQVVLLVLLLREGAAMAGPVPRPDWRVVPSILLVACLGWAFWLAGPSLLDVLSPHGHGGYHTRTIKGFSPIVLLGTFAQERGEGDEEVAARVYSAHRPTYLTGVVHDLYGAGSWRTSGRSRSLASPRNLGDAMVFCRDDRDPGKIPAGWIQLAIPTQGYLLLPPATACQAVVADSAMGFPGGGVVSPQAELGRGIWWYPDTGRDTSINPSDIIVPRSLEGLLDSALAEIAPDPSGRGSRNLSKALTAWFSRSFRYSLVPGWAKGEDPLRKFLRERSGYCEYFATASVLLLRRSGIPARYATGYAYPDRGPGDSWIFRRSSAHAWVLMRDPARGWIPFDPTPAADRPSSGVGAWTRLVQDWDGRLQGAWHLVRDGNWRTVLDRISESPILGGGVWLWIAMAAGAALPVLWNRRRRKMGAATDPASVWLARLERAESRLRRDGHLREPGETVKRFVSRIPSEANQKAKGILDDYLERRFAPPKMGTGPD